MKAVLRFSYLIALPFTVIAFILMIKTNAISTPFKNGIEWFVTGEEALFGAPPIGSRSAPTYPSSVALASWIIAIVVMVILLLGSVLRIMYGDDFHGLHIFLRILCIIGLLISGIFIFFVVTNFIEINKLGAPFNSTRLGQGWGLAASFYFLSALIITSSLVFGDR